MTERLGFRFTEKEGDRVIVIKSTSFKSARRTLRRRLGKKGARKFFTH